MSRYTLDAAEVLQKAIDVADAAKSSRNLPESREAGAKLALAYVEIAREMRAQSVTLQGTL